MDRQEQELERQLKETKQLRNKLETETLVELLDKFEQPEVVTSTGAKAKRKLHVVGSLPKVGDKDTEAEAAENRRKRSKAIEVAEGYGWQPFIKSTVQAAFDKTDRDKAVELYNEIRRNSNSADVSIDETIHPMTLQAQVRKRIQAGLDVQLDALGVTAMAAVKLVK